MLRIVINNGLLISKCNIYPKIENLMKAKLGLASYMGDGTFEI